MHIFLIRYFDCVSKWLDMIIINLIWFKFMWASIYFLVYTYDFCSFTQYPLWKPILYFLFRNLVIIVWYSAWYSRMPNCRGIKSKCSGGLGGCCKISIIKVRVHNKRTELVWWEVTLKGAVSSKKVSVDVSCEKIFHFVDYLLRRKIRFNL